MRILRIRGVQNPMNTQMSEVRIITKLGIILRWKNELILCKVWISLNLARTRRVEAANYKFL